MSKQEKGYQVIIFDWDGTLVDSTGRIVDSMQRAARDIGLPEVPDSAVQNIIGLGLPEAIKTVWPDIQSDQLPPMSAAYAHYFVVDSQVGMDFFPEARDMLERLRSNHRLAVATGKSRKGLDRMLDDMAIRHCFDITRCADETKSKPNPQMLVEILAELDLQPNQALMVGDTSYDLDMAKAIGMDSIGMSHGAHDESVLLACGPRAICHSIQELELWIGTHG
jgi:phosphoglycolate phosphatase|tara:strand:- start:2913 stop:3578 length:666 start_codon:yes stop_codon:yes gene_type:complete